MATAELSSLVLKHLGAMLCMHTDSPEKSRVVISPDTSPPQLLLHIRNYNWGNKCGLPFMH